MSETSADENEIISKLSTKMLKLVNLQDKKIKTALLAKNSRNILEVVLSAEDLESQETNHQRARAVVKGLVQNIDSKLQPLFQELWGSAEAHPQLSHAANVATYTVLISLALGKSENEWILDLAFAGLLHDIGLSKISFKISSQPWTESSQKDFETYLKHVESSLELIDGFGPDIPDRVKTLVRQHHEKFDGSGYPDHLKGNQTEIPSQVLSLVELIDSVSSGQWDNQKRTYRETLKVLKNTQALRPQFPEFNPEIFSAILRWTKTDNI